MVNNLSINNKMSLGSRFGLGVILGEPTGLTMKGYVSPVVALDLIASWSFVDDAITIIGDVTWDVTDVAIQSTTFSMPFYLGAGIKVGFVRGGKNKGKEIVGARVPVGLAMQFTRIPLEAFVEVAPGMEFTPATEFDFTGGLGARFYF